MLALHSAFCPICGKEKTYKTAQGLSKCKDKPCKSCSNSLKAGGKGYKTNRAGLVRCAKCDNYKHKNDFNIRKNDNKPYSYCKKCHVSSHKSYFNATYRYSRYGITKEQYTELLSNQNNTCGGCRLTLTSPKIDHCHSSGNVRGLLCHNCNTALGLLRDNTKTLANLVEYLEKNK